MRFPKYIRQQLPQNQKLIDAHQKRMDAKAEFERHRAEVNRMIQSYPRVQGLRDEDYCPYKVERQGKSIPDCLIKYEREG